jgi:Tfp pilus assembly protein PilN
MSTTTAVRTHALPRVNLLPPEIEERRRQQVVKVALGGAVVASMAVVAVLFLGAVSQEHSAKQALASSKSQNDALQRQAAQYADVPATYVAVASAKTQLGQAMGQEVRWSYFLNDLSLRMPTNVWLTKLSITQSVDGTPAGGSASGAGTALFTPGLGQITVEGNALVNNDVAAWLESLARQKGLNQVYFTDSKATKIGSTKTVEFKSQGTITSDALSRRYITKAGS